METCNILCSIFDNKLNRLWVWITTVKFNRINRLSSYPDFSKLEKLDQMLESFIEEKYAIHLVGFMVCGLELPSAGRYARNRSICGVSNNGSGVKSLLVISEALEVRKKIKKDIRRLAKSYDDLIVFYADKGRLPDVNGQHRLSRVNFLKRFNDRYQLIHEKEVNGLGLYQFKRKS